ncbi:hypothetical protein A9K55_007704 [Cordyceps militaris]|uniref:DUF4246 domain-containing protein n=1 Tax=Cordyceps militaris TaxID=73501 RepID=A0A2H4SI45_CORMI|nr:hypothetical protein A9K55_007704 [Cordyceps militaris]
MADMYSISMYVHIKGFISIGQIQGPTQWLRLITGIPAPQGTFVYERPRVSQRSGTELYSLLPNNGEPVKGKQDAEVGSARPTGFCVSSRSGIVLASVMHAQSLHLSPWMFPFTFEISPIRTDGHFITRDNFLDSMTVGGIRRLSFWDPDAMHNGHPSYYSGKSQWLATDVRFSSNSGAISIISPVNNLHPVRHKPIYTAVEYLVSDLIDDWNQTLLYKTLARGVSRIQPNPFKCEACSDGSFHLCSCSVEFRESSAWANDRQNNVEPNAWFERGWNPVMALDGKYASSRRSYDNVSLRDGFRDRGLQIYLEIMTINLDKGGSVSPESAR